jgi:hypothetical protein
MIGTNHKSKVLLQRRDRLVFQVLKTAGVASQQHLSALAGFTSRTRASSRLALLSRAGYLKHRYTGTIAGGRKVVYALRGALRHSKRGPAGFEAAIAHRLAINDVRVAVHRAVTERQLVYAWEGPIPLLEGALVPDARIVILEPDPMLYLLESDLDTEATSIWPRKVGNYLLLAKQQNLQGQLGFDRFRVLIVAPSERRVRQLQWIALQATSKLFWFTTFDLLTSEGFFAPHWVRPGSGEKHSLLKEAYEILPIVQTLDARKSELLQ